MTLPLLISVPHAGTQIPPEVESINLLRSDQIIRDGDEGAREIYDLKDEVEAFVTTDIARAFLDMNRPEDDLSSDGVVKTETIYREPIYAKQPDEGIRHNLLERYYFPYHRKLSELVNGIVLGIDCHTMAAVAPPISSDAGSPRPDICISNANGTCSAEWTQRMASYLSDEFGRAVSINDPFKGGHIIRSHACELPWLQIELSRAQFAPLESKRKSLIRAFRRWCETTLS